MSSTSQDHNDLSTSNGVELSSTSVMAFIGLCAELVYRLELPQPTPIKRRAEVFLATAYLDIQEKIHPFDETELNQKDRDALAYLVDSLGFFVEGYHENTFPPGR